jgi:hypothetical protein
LDGALTLLAIVGLGLLIATPVLCGSSALRGWTAARVTRPIRR